MIGNKKKIWKNWLVTLFISVIIGCVGVGAWWTIQENELNTIQKEALTEVIENSGEYAEDTIVLQNTTHEEAKRLAEKFDATLRITSDGSFATLKLTDGRTVEDVYSVRENRIELEKLSLDYHTKTSEGAEEEEAMERLPASPNYTVTDSEYALQSYIDYVNVGNAWNQTKGSGITVAVIDTGIDTDHPEFAGRISEYSYNATEDKIVKDYTAEDGGYDWSLIEDEQGHGTAVTGVIASAMDGNGIVGIAPEVNIIVIKAECDENGSFYNTSDLVFGLYYAIERDVQVVNMSFGGRVNSFAEATQLAVDSDIICVAAAGNDATTDLTYPAADPKVIGVGALAEDSWELAEYSNYGENTDVVAPGTTYTTKKGGEYGVMSGTSLASPVVAGAIALHMTVNRYTEFKVVQEILFASTYDLGSLGKDWYYGYGALDINALVCEERGTVTFNMLTDELENTEQVFIRNHTLQNLPEPERNYAVFDGWYYDIHCTEELNWYADKFTGDLTLYAKWVNEDDGVPYTYVELEDGTIEIRSYTGKRRYITIPEKIDGKIVSSIGDVAFSGQTRLRQVNLPSGLNNIGAYAFENCNNLVEMNIPQGVKQIGMYAFHNNVRLTSVNFEGAPAITKIGDFAFSNSGLLRFEVPQNVSYLNGSALFGASGLKAISVHAKNASFISENGVLYNNTKSTIVAYPAGLNTTFKLLDETRTIGAYAFGYAKLKAINFNKVTSIGANAFAYSQLQSISIPDTVTSLGESVFAYNFNLKEVNLGNGITAIPVGAFTNASALQTINVPAQVQSIEGKAFAGSGLNSVTFAEGSKLVQIGAEAFYYVPLKAATLPESLVSIGAGAFAKNYFLEEVNFGSNSNLQYIGGSAFEKAYSLTEIAFPAQLQQIGDYAFQESGLTGSVSIPMNVTYFGAGAFADCDNVTAIEVEENNAKYLDENGIVYTKDLNEIVAYPAGNEATMYAINAETRVVATSAFHGADNLYTVEIPNGLTNIEMYAFTEMNGLQYMNIPDEVIQISNYAFAYDYNLTNINFNETSKLPRISYAAFAYTGINSFRVPANVSTMAQYAFEGSTNLRKVTFAANSKLESISAYMFAGSENLVSITFEEGSALTSIQAHGLEGMSKLQTVDFGGARLTNIDNFAFRFNTSLQTLNLPDTLTNIGRYAFYGCENMTSLALPASMEHIGRFAFLGAEQLDLYFASSTLPLYLDENWDYGIKGYYVGVTNVTTAGDWKYAQLTDGTTAIIEYMGASSVVDLTELNFGTITQIGGYAFYDTDVTSIVLPETLDSIQRYAFAFSQIENVTIPANVSFIGNNAFFYTPLKSVTFAENSEIRTIEQSAFSYCRELSEITLPASLTTLGSSAFESAGLTSVAFEDNIALTEIPEKAFMGTKLTTVTLPDNVTLVNHNAFRDIAELTTVNWGNGDVQLMSNVFYNTGLTTVNIPENMEYIGEYAFVGLTELKAFTVDENNEYYSANNGLLYNKSGSKLIAVPAGLEGELTLPNTVEVIGFGAFENTSLSEINFAADSNILTFGYRAFFGAKNLTEITIPASVVSIDYYAFANCENLTTVNFAEGNKLTGIYEGAFYGCTSLANIMLPDSIVEISDFAFYGCIGLTKLPISETSQLKGIYDYAFAYSGITELDLPDTLWDIGNYAFRGLKITSVVIPDAQKEKLVIGIGAFQDCNMLEEITAPFIGASFEDPDYTWFGYIFGAGAYRANGNYVPESLKTVMVTEGITFIGAGAFYGIITLETIQIPHSVDLIYYEAFTGTSAIYTLSNNIRFKDEVEQNIITYTAFDNHTASHFGSGLSGMLTLADGVIIGSNAFFNCSSLTSVKIPHGATSIAEGAFSFCSNLTSIEIPDSVTSIGDEAFSSCSNLKSIEIPDGVMIIGDYVFSHCSSLTSIEIPDGVTSIGDRAFYNCSILMSIEIPDGVTSIGDWAFDNCVSLYQVTNRSDLTFTIGSEDNGGVAYYAQVLIDKEGNVIYKEDGVVYIDTADSFRFIQEDGEYKLVAYFGGEDTITLPQDFNGRQYIIYQMRGVKNVIIPNGIISIDDYAFYDCDSLTSIVIPSGVTSIGYGAFYDCDSLTSIVIPEGVISIGGDVFSWCDNLIRIEIPNSVTSIGYAGFRGCGSLTSIEIPNSVTEIASEVFRYCDGLISIMIPEGVTSINSYAFQDCSSLTSITIPASVSWIGEGAFSGCPLDSLVIDKQNLFFTEMDGVIYNKDQTRIIFVPNSVESVTIPNTVTDISGAFSGCENLKTVLFEENSQLFSIGYKAFSGCNNLLSIVIPDSVTNIGDNAFDGCSSLMSIVIPNNVMSIGGFAFNRCSSLSSLEIPNSVIEIGYAAFQACALKNIVIPNSVESIGNWAFSGCSSLVSIEIPDSITSIGDYICSSCSSLISIKIPNSVESIGNWAFSGCSSLTSVEIPNSVESIGDCAFSDCSGLTSIEIPNSIESIGDYAYSGCVLLYQVTNHSDLTFTIGSEDNGRVAYYAQVLIDKEGNTTYKEDGVVYVDTADGFRFIQEDGEYKLVAYFGREDTITLPQNFNGRQYIIYQMRGVKNVIIPDGIMSIDDYAFYDCDSLTSIVIPSSVTNMGIYAFSFCDSLTSVKISDGVTSIADNAFSFCSSLTNIVIPDSVTSISLAAFRECRSLINIVMSDSVTSIEEFAFENTAYYNNPNNWKDGMLYIGNALICLNSTAKIALLKAETFCIAENAFEECYSLINLTIGGDYWYRLDSLSNLQTLVINKIPTGHNILQYFGWESSALPLTLKNIIITEENAVNMRQEMFEGITGVNIYVEKAEIDLRWDENYPGWNNGNRVYYLGDWISVDSYNQNGEWLDMGYYSTSQIIHMPWLTDYIDGAYRYIFKGYDINGDGKADFVPATSAQNIVANAIYTCELVCVRDGHTESDWIVDIKATCTTAGSKHKKCTVCGETLETEEILALGHDEVSHETKAPTCTEIGWNAYETCTRCDYSTWSEIIATGHSYNGYVTAPTCTEEGYTTYICHCGDSYVSDYVDPMGHDYVYHAGQSATCTENGWNAYETCTRCDYSTWSEIIATGHSYNGYVTAPTCEGYGYTTYTCYCGDSYVSDYMDPIGHDYVYRGGQSATCTENGWNAYETCTRCDYSTWSEIIATGHSYSSYVTSPTCTEQGYTTYICHCGDSYISDYIDAMGHSYSTYTIAPTCEEYGYTTYTCYCGDTYKADYLEALGHTEVINEAKAATCTETGLTEGKHCSACEEVLVKQEVIPATGHSYGEWYETKTATCEETGAERRDCGNCDHYETREISALGHDEVSHEAKAPTCTEIGWKAYETCTRCDYSTYEEIPASGHDYEAVVTAPTCTEEGYTTYTCHCGETYKADYVDALGHKESDWIVNKEAEIGVKGHKHTECTVCGETLKEEDIPALNKPQDSSSSMKPEVPDSSVDSNKPSTPNKPSQNSSSNQTNTGGGCFGSINNEAIIMTVMLLAFTLFMSKKQSFKIK